MCTAMSPKKQNISKPVAASMAFTFFVAYMAYIWVHFTVGDDQRLEMSRKHAGVFCYKIITRHAGNFQGLLSTIRPPNSALFSHGGGL